MNLGNLEKTEAKQRKLQGTKEAEAEAEAIEKDKQQRERERNREIEEAMTDLHLQ